MMVVRSIAAVALASLVVQQPPPTFRSDVNYVEVDASVTDRAGAAVTGLEKTDFVLYEDRKPQPITTFTKVQLSFEAAAARAAVAARLDPADAASNPPFDGRVFAIVLDNMETAFHDTKRVRDAAAAFVSDDVGPNDLVAVVGSGGTMSQALTHDSALALRAIRSFSGAPTESAALAAEEDSLYDTSGRGRGAGATGVPPGNVQLNGAERFENALAMLETIKSLTSYLAPIRGRRKGVLLFSSGVDYDLNDLTNPRARQLEEMLRQTISAANRSDVSFYTIDSQGLVAPDLSQFETFGSNADRPGWESMLHGELLLSHDSLRVLADQTNGFATVDTNDLAPAFARIRQENSSYYLLGFDTKALDGKIHAIDVKMVRPGLVVRARKAYLATKPGSSSPSDSPIGKSSALMGAMANPISVSDIQMRVSAAPFKTAQSTADLYLTVEMNASRFSFKENGGRHSDAVELEVLSANQKGKLTVDEHRVIALEAGDNYHAVRDRGIRLAERFAIKPGQYRLMIGAREINGGLIGTVPLDVAVPDFARDAPSISGILMTSTSAAGVVTTGADMTLKQFMPAPPTAERTFTRADMLSLFAEVYARPGASSHAPVVSASVVSYDGSQSHPVSAGVPAARPGSPPGTYVYTGRIPLQAFAPGRYLLRIVASAADAAPRHERDVPFVVH